MFKKNRRLALSICSLLFLVTSAHSDHLTLYVPIMDDSPQQHLFFHDLLNRALKEAGHELTLVSKKLPQLRIKKYMDEGELSIFWALESAALNKKYIPIKVGLTDGFIGKRVLLIKEGDQFLYDSVKNLNDFQQLNLVAGMGRGWFDVDIWEKNQLKYKESSGNWKSIFKMIPYGRDYHYISRGVNEIISEATQYPDLEIEKKLVFIYDRDFYFYLSKTGTHSGNEFKNIIEKAMINAEKSGLIKKLNEKYWPDVLKQLNYDSRIKIHLEMP
tara:strand:- start:18080 stop:18895 length:816 start_codon:yes stop_codon:yes gene_type:complete